MTFPTPRTALMGNPPQPGYAPRKQDIVSVLEQMQAIAATEMLKDFHGAVGDLPGEGNETGDKRAVLAAEGDGGGVYSWDGSEWVLVSALPVVLTDSLSAQEALQAAQDAVAAADRAETAAAGVEFPVSYAPQSLSAGQKAQARENIGAGNGDMLTDTYDPQGIGADAFDRTKHTGTQEASTITGLAAVATSGAYHDLSGVPAVVVRPKISDFAFQIIAHRGAPMFNPEETIASYDWCVTNGIQLLEGDIRLSSDETPILAHDAISGTVGDLVSTSVPGNGSPLGAQPYATLSQLCMSRRDDSILIIEGKVDGAVPKIVGTFNAHGISRDQAVIADFTHSRLAPAVADGWITEALIASTASTGEATTNVAAIDGAGIARIGLNKSHSDAIIGEYVSGPLPVYLYTLFRRSEAERVVSLGVDGFYADDPLYLATDVPIAAEDAWARGEWMPGMLAPSESLTAVNRGRLFDGGWGWDTSFRPDTVASNPVLQGWACPAIADPETDTLIIEYSAKYISDEADTRWGGLFVADESMEDAEVLDSASAPASENIMSFFCRRNGSLEIFKRLGGTSTNLDTVSSSAITLGTTQHFRVTVTPTTATFERLDGPGGAATHTASTSDTDVRGAYFHLGVNRAAVLFSRVKVIKP